MRIARAFLRYILTCYVVWFTTVLSTSQQIFFMKSEREAQNRRASVVYPLVVSAVTAAATVGLAVLAARNLRLAWWANALDCVMIGGVSFLAARIGAACAGGFGRKTLIGLGVLGMAISVATCAWGFHRASF